MARVILAVFAALAIIFGVDGTAPATWTNPVLATTDGSGTCGSIIETIAVGTDPSITIAGAGSISDYTITGQETAGAITIAAASGALAIAANAFDFETKTTYLLTITASTDGAVPSGTVTCTITITDGNDAPTFSQYGYIAYMTTGATAGTAVTTLSASDVDPTDTTFTYAITGGNTNADFAIGAATGAVTVATGKTLDSTTTSGYYMTITGTDDGSAAGTTYLLVVFGSASGAMQVACTGLLVSLATMLAFVFK